jgi:peptide/nickel transport system ATP-binding protein
VVRSSETSPLIPSAETPTPAAPVLSVDGLSIAFPGRRRGVLDTVVQDVSFQVWPNEVLGIVGESGSGKTVTALSIMGLLPPQATIQQGSVRFDGTDLLTAPEAALRKIRGSRISMIFQSPRSSLNPLIRIGRQLERIHALHLGVSGREASRRSIDLLGTVGIRQPEWVMSMYPHQLSGGMCQRVMIAMMIACGPRLLIADEPTTALDVTIQLQIFELLRSIREQLGLTIVLITHDLGVVAETCSRVAVMYRGQLMEMGDVAQVFAAPRHPYTAYLLGSALRVDRTTDLAAAETVNRGAQQRSTGCQYAGRCPSTMAQCWTSRPAITQTPDAHQVACHLYEEARQP